MVHLLRPVKIRETKRKKRSWKVEGKITFFISIKII